MNAILAVFGAGSDLTYWQMAARGAAIFAITLLLIRMAGRRAFGQRTPFDGATTVLLGAVLSRAVVGASPFWATIAAAITLALLHRVVGFFSVRSDRFDVLINGQERLLVADGQKYREAMAAALITDRDLAEALRKKLGDDDLIHVRRATLERDGAVSVARNR